MKNITLSADDKLIAAARKQAEARGTTLNEEFRQWLKETTVTPQQRVERYRQLMQKLSYVNAGRKFSRQELNERKPI